MESAPVINSTSEDSKEKQEVDLSIAGTKISHETPTSCQNVEGCLTKEKFDVGRQDCHKENYTENEIGISAADHATIFESKLVKSACLKDGCTDIDNTKMGAANEVAPVPKNVKMVETHNDVCIDGAEDHNLASKDGTNKNSVGNIAVLSRSLTSLSRTIPKKKRRREEMYYGNENDDNFVRSNEDEDFMSADISLNQLKRQVLGRDLKVYDENRDWEDKDDAEMRQIQALMNASNANDDDHISLANADTTGTEKCDTESSAIVSTKPKLSSLSLSEKLRKDLLCAICHEVVYPPVALQCGHSFCQPCIDWWFDHDDAGRCPTCRRRSYPETRNHSRNATINTSPNLALRACVMTLFGPEIILRIQNRKKLRPKGESGGAHNAGYQILSQLRDETWHYVTVRTDSGNSSNPPSNTTTIQVRRSIVLDAEDQRMQLALAVYQKPIKEVGLVPNNGNASRGHTGRFRVELCVLTMEEDEAVDSGFPTNVVSPEDEFFVCGNRFLFSHLEVQMKDENGCLSPLARVSADADNGRFTYILDPAESAGNAGTETIRALLFQHSETGSQLEIDLSRIQNRAGGNFMLPPNNQEDSSDEDFVKRRNITLKYNDDTEENEDENQDEFEEDGFLVDDDESNNGAFSDEEDGVCNICKDGGELMICDGGEKHPGCGMSFHVACVNRSAIPDGDWICQGCAKVVGIETGIEGHEFQDPEVTRDRKRDDDQTSEHDESCDFASDNSEDNSDVEGAFSDEDQKAADSQESTSLGCKNASASQIQQDDDESDLKSSVKSNKFSSTRRFVLEDSDSD